MKVFKYGALCALVISSQLVAAESTSFWDLLTGAVSDPATITYSPQSGSYTDSNGRVVFSQDDLRRMGQAHWVLNPELKLVEGKGYVNTKTNEIGIGRDYLTLLAASAAYGGDRKAAQDIAALAMKSGATQDDLRRVGFEFEAAPQSRYGAAEAKAGDGDFEFLGKKYRWKDVLDFANQLGTVLAPQQAK